MKDDINLLTSIYSYQWLRSKPVGNLSGNLNVVLVMGMDLLDQLRRARVIDQPLRSLLLLIHGSLKDRHEVDFVQQLNGYKRTYCENPAVLFYLNHKNKY